MTWLQLLAATVLAGIWWLMFIWIADGPTPPEWRFWQRKK